MGGAKKRAGHNLDTPGGDALNLTVNFELNLYFEQTML